MYMPAAMVVASSSVAQVRTRICASLSTPQDALLVSVRHAQDPAEVVVPRRLLDLGRLRGARLAKGVLQRVYDQRRGNRFGHRASLGQ
jgi:hypothetical protein